MAVASGETRKAFAFGHMKFASWQDENASTRMIIHCARRLGSSTHGGHEWSAIYKRMSDSQVISDITLQRRAALPLFIDVDPHFDSTAITIGPEAIPWTTEDGQTHAVCDVESGRPRVLFPNIGIIRVIDDTGQVRGMVNDQVKIPFLKEVYHRFALPMILQSAGAEMIHASAIHTKAGVFAFCGISGTGKSTLAYTFAQRGYRHWADDAVVFVPDRNAFQSLRLPFRPRVEIVDSQALEFVSGTEFAHLAAIVVLERYKDEMVQSADFRADAEKLAAASAFRAVLPHIYSFRLSDSRRNALMMSRYFDIASRLPIFRVRFTPCLDALPKLCEVVENSCFSAV